MRRQQPPGPRGSRWSGNLAAYEADRLGFLLAARDEYGEVVRFGPRSAILNDPVAVASVLQGGADAFAVRENFLQQRLSDAQSRDVLDLRRALNPGMRRRAVTPIEAILARRLDAAIPSLLADEVGRWVDPLPVLESVISGSVGEFYFGPEPGDLPMLVGDLLDELSRVIGNPFALPERWSSPTRRRIAAKHLHLRGRVAGELRSRAATAAPRDLAGDIAARAGGRHPVERVADMVIGSLLAAQRVPAAAACWLLMLLADDPSTQRAIRHERTATDDVSAPVEGNRAAAGRAGGGLAERVVWESLRLYPPTWLLTRTATRPVSVGGYDFEAGHHFLISPYVLHRDPQAFTEPEAFRPDRWGGAAPGVSSYLPYGAGVHACPGRHLATRILTTIAEIAADHHVARRPGPVGLDPRTTLLPVGLGTAFRPPISRARPLDASSGGPSRMGREDQLPALAAASF